MKNLGLCIDRNGSVSDLYTDGKKYYRLNPKKMIILEGNKARKALTEIQEAEKWKLAKVSNEGPFLGGFYYDLVTKDWIAFDNRIGLLALGHFKTKEDAIAWIEGPLKHPIFYAKKIKERFKKNPSISRVDHSKTKRLDYENHPERVEWSRSFAKHDWPQSGPVSKIFPYDFIKGFSDDMWKYFPGGGNPWDHSSYDYMPMNKKYFERFLEIYDFKAVERFVIDEEGYYNAGWVPAITTHYGELYHNGLLVGSYEWDTLVCTSLIVVADVYYWPEESLLRAKAMFEQGSRYSL